MRKNIIILCIVTACLHAADGVLPSPVVLTWKDTVGIVGIEVDREKEMEFSRRLVGDRRDLAFARYLLEVSEGCPSDRHQSESNKTRSISHALIRALCISAQMNGAEAIQKTSNIFLNSGAGFADAAPIADMLSRKENQEIAESIFKDYKVVLKQMAIWRTVYEGERLDASLPSYLHCSNDLDNWLICFAVFAKRSEGRGTPVYFQDMVKTQISKRVLQYVDSIYVLTPEEIAGITRAIEDGATPPPAPK